jgi:hypothetical protein
MKIELSENELLKLSQLVYLGNWMRDSYPMCQDSCHART